MLTGPVLGNLELAGHNNALWFCHLVISVRGSVDIQSLQLDIFDNALLALGQRKCGVGTAVLCAGGGGHAPPAAHACAVFVTADGTETTRVLVGCFRGGEGTTEDGLEPCTQEREDHGQVGGDDRNEAFANTPLASELGTIDRILVDQGSVRKIFAGTDERKRGLVVLEGG